MEKSFEESARQRRNYIAQARAAFGSQEQSPNNTETASAEPAESTSTLGIRLVIALLLFICFVYCDQEHITFQGIGVQEIVKQVTWNPLPTEKLEELFGDISITGGPKSSNPQ